MKLINFFQVREFNELREKMNASLKIWYLTYEWIPFDPDQILSALDRDGEIEIKADQLTIAEDNTLELLGRKILVYIRDQIGHASRGNPNFHSNYKFHIANCATLKKFQTANRYDRYVASIKTDGLFKIHVHDKNSKSFSVKLAKLRVCVNCLKTINYKGFNDLLLEQNKICENFSIEEFFALYKYQRIIKPRHTDLDAPSSLDSQR